MFTYSFNINRLVVSVKTLLKNKQIVAFLLILTDWIEIAHHTGWGIHSLEQIVEKSRRLKPNAWIEF